MQHFENDLAGFKDALLVMASKAEAAVTHAVRALVDRNDQYAEQVKAGDTELDRLEVEIDERAIRLLSMAPLAGDLRLITVAMKISQNLERIGDEATTIARRSIELNTEPQLKPYLDLPRMARIALAMLHDAMDAFVTGNAARGREIIPRDKEVDGINKQLHRELSSYMVERPSTIGRCLNLMVISKALERIADHASNIAEEVVYLFEAEDIRHPGRKKPAEE